MCLSRLSSYSYLRVEAYITMLDRFGSGGNVKFCKQSKEFHDLIESIHHSDIANHNHFAVTMAYLDLALRYEFVIANNPSRLVRLITAKEIQPPTSRHGNRVFSVEIVKERKCTCSSLICHTTSDKVIEGKAESISCNDDREHHSFPV